MLESAQLRLADGEVRLEDEQRDLRALAQKTRANWAISTSKKSVRCSAVIAGLRDNAP